MGPCNLYCMLQEQCQAQTDPNRSHGTPRATFATAINLEPSPLHWAAELSHPRENEYGPHRTLLLYPEKGSGEASKEDKSQPL